MLANLKTSVIAFVIASLAGAAWSSDLYVARNDPAADNKNPGTEAKPLKTIQAGVDKAQPGDTIWVKAGLYQEPVHIAKSGRLGAPITLAAWKEDRVRVGFPPEPLPGEGKWAPAPGSKSFQIKLAKDVPDDLVLILNERPLNTKLKDGPPPDGRPLWATYRKADRTLMFNSNGKDPSSLGKLEFSRRADLSFWVDWQEWWVIRGLEFQWQYAGIHFIALNSTVEDCFFHNIYGGAMSAGVRTCTVRRCNFYRCGSALWGNGLTANVYEDNLIVDCGVTADEDINNDGVGGEFGGGPTCFKGNILGLVFAYNIVADCRGGAGWYADIDAKSCRVIGNAFWNLPGDGVYNEASVDDTLIIGNYFYKCGVSSSACRRLNIVDNFFEEGRVVWHNRDWGLDRYSYMLLRGNAFFNPPPPYLSGGWGRSTLYPEAFRSCMVDYNRIWTTPGAVLIDSYGSAVKKTSIEAVRKDLHWEEHGEVLPLPRGVNATSRAVHWQEHGEVLPRDRQAAAEAVAAMGGSRVTFRVPWGRYSKEARPMLSYAEGRWPSLPDGEDCLRTTPAFFWRIADGNYDVAPLGNNWTVHGTGSRWKSASTAGYDLGENAGCRWCIGAEPKFPDKIAAMGGDKASLEKYPLLQCWSNGRRWLEMKAVTREKMLPQGVGYWSPLLSTAPGAKITVALRMRGKDLVSDDKGSPAVWMEFTNETGRNRRRAFLVGKDDQGEMHNADFTKGSYDWKELKETITAPNGAIRAALFFGLLPCKGEVDFIDVHMDAAGEAAS